MSLVDHLGFSILANLIALVAVAFLRSAPPRLVTQVCLVGMCTAALPWGLLGTWVAAAGVPEELAVLARISSTLGTSTAANTPRGGWMVVLVAVWLSVAGTWLCATWVCSHRARRRWRASALPGHELMRLVSPPLLELAENVEMHRVPEARLALLTGLRRREIWIGAGITDERHLRVAVNHELCHLAAGDQYLVHVISLVERLLWWNPLVWALGRAARRHLEYDCDQRCLRLLGSETYRKTLAEMALARMPLAGVLAMSSSGIVQRMERLKMNYETNTSHVLSLAVAGITLGIACSGLASSAPARTLLACNDLLPDGVTYRMEIKSLLDTREDTQGSISVTLLDEQKPGSTEVPEGSEAYARCVLEVLGVPEEDRPEGL